MENNFNDFPYERPIKLSSEGKIIIDLMDTVFLTDKFTRITIPYEISYTRWGDSPKGGKQTIQMPKFDYTSESSVIQANYINVKHNCIRVAELINTQLLSFLVSYKGPIDISLKDDLNRFDFLKLRDELSKIIKKDKRFLVIDILNTLDKRNDFTKNFTYFIEDRNIYTHGHLKVRLDDIAILIEFKDKSTLKNGYCQVNSRIMQSFFYTAHMFKDTLTKMYNIIKSP